jgi:2-succinyl-6-hydroxy-2,4-cyclohexadiene-1-carboxylate synthase
MKQTNLIFLHGTLQRAHVWNPIIETIKKTLPEIPCSSICPDMYEDNPDSIHEWLDGVDQTISSKDRNILIGYSLGGRFALSLYKKDPDKYAGLVLVCTDPGLEDESKRDLLLKNDEKWATNFQEMEWERLLHAWNQLPVFAGVSNPIPPREMDFNRTELSRLWLLSSKAKNPSLWNIIPDINVPTLVITGTKDTKFDSVGKEMVQRNKDYITQQQFQGIGHRVPWEDKNRFVEVMRSFIT